MRRYLHKTASGIVKNKTVRATPATWYWSSTENSVNNAWNVNFSSGNTNNNNKYNSNAVRAVAALTEEEIAGWIAAFEDCCRHKMSSVQCVMYRLEYEQDLLMLAAEVKLGIYRPKTSVCFCVSRPKVREIFAAAFRDRIAQHWIVLRIEPLLEARFVAQGNVSFNCRKGFGTLKAVEALERDIIALTDGWKREAYVGRYDLSGFFMSINKDILWQLYETWLRGVYRGDDLDLLLELSRITIMHCPQLDCQRRGDLSLWERLPKRKSLFNLPPDTGMPIGNITSQLLANFYLSYFDEWITGRCAEVGARYERFVDDFIIVARGPKEINAIVAEAGRFLMERLKLTLHPHKKFLQPARHGVLFVGTYVMPGRRYTSNRTVGGFVDAIRTLDAASKAACQQRHTLRILEELEHGVMAVNSYLGFLVHTASYAIRVKRMRRARWAHWCCPPDQRYTKLKVRKEMRVREYLTRTEQL